LLALQEQAA
jgi:hypothetical protein